MRSAALARCLAALTFATALGGCGHVTVVRPVPEGELTLEGSLGGPMAEIPGIGVMPMPLATGGLRYGVSDGFEVSAHAHLTSLLFGVGGVDVGAAWLALEQQAAAPAVTLSGRVYGFLDFDLEAGPSSFLEAAATTSWRLGAFTPFVGATALLQLAPSPPLLSLGAGSAVSLGPVELQLELRWYAPHTPTDRTVVDWVGPGRLGALGLVLGGRFDFDAPAGSEGPIAIAGEPR